MKTGEKWKWIINRWINSYVVFVIENEKIIDNQDFRSKLYNIKGGFLVAQSVQEFKEST